MRCLVVVRPSFPVTFCICFGPAVGLSVSLGRQFLSASICGDGAFEVFYTLRGRMSCSVIAAGESVYILCREMSKHADKVM